MVWLEYFRVITGLLYLFLEIKQRKTMWVVGFLTSFVYVFVSLSARICTDMGLQIYYVGISIYGFYQRTRKKHKIHTENDGLPSDHILCTHLSLPLFVRVIGTLAAVFATLWYFFHQFTGSPVPIGDAFATSVGIVAVWMLTRQIIEHWAFWVIINLIFVYLYYPRDLYPTMLLYFYYTTLVIVGYYNWWKEGGEF